MSGQTLNRRHFIVGLSAGAAGVTLSSFNQAHAQTGTGAAEIAKLYEAAKKEGKITFYCSNNPVLTQRVVKAFNAKYPDVRVDVLRLATGPLGKRYMTEVEAGNVVADVLQLADPILIEDAYEKQWLASIEDLPAHAAFPASFKGPGYAIVGINPHTISYNTQMVKPSEIPKQWTDLLDPRWKDQIMSADLRVSPLLLDWAYLMKQTYGADFLKRLGAQNIRWVPSTVPGTQQLAAGEAAILAPNQRQVTFSVIQQGGPIEEETPAPHTGHESHIGISAKAPHPAGARLLANFVISPEGAEALNRDISASPLPNISGALPLPASYRRTKLRETFKHQAEILDLLGLK